MAKPTNAATLVNRELRLMLEEAKDGCNDCNDDYVCPKHYKAIADAVAKPKHYVEVKCINGEWKSKRLRELV